MMSAARRAMPCRFVVWAIVPFLALASGTAAAQTAATSFDALQSRVKPGDVVDVTETSGRKSHGRINQFSQSALEIVVRKTGPDGRDTLVPMRLAERDVRQVRVEHPDSILNGTLIGAAIGGGPFLVVGVAAASVGGGSCGSDSNVCLGVGLITGAIGAGVGAMIDASKHRRTTVFDTRSRSAVLQLSPVLSPSVRGLQVSMRF